MKVRGPDGAVVFADGPGHESRTVGRDRAEESVAVEPPGEAAEAAASEAEAAGVEHRGEEISSALREPVRRRT